MEKNRGSKPIFKGYVFIAGMLIVTCCIWLAAGAPMALAQHGDEHQDVAGAHSDNGHAGDAHAAQGHGAHPAPSILSLFWPLVNFSLYAALMVYGYRRLARPVLKDRAIDLQAHMKKAAGLLTDAEEEYDSLKQRLEQIASEQAELVDRLVNEGKNIAHSVAAAAEASAADLKQETARRIAAETAKAQAEVRREVVAQATRTARERIIRELSPEDDARLREEAIRSLGFR